MLGECHISFFILSSLYFYLTLSILGRYSDLGVSANLHISFYPPYTNHGMEGEGIEHPTSGTSFIETVAILDVVAVSAATFDVYLKQFLDAMDVVDEGSSGEFRSLTEVRVQPSALDFLQGDAAPFLCPVDGFHEPDIFV